MGKIVALGKAISRFGLFAWRRVSDLNTLLWLFPGGAAVVAAGLSLAQRLAVALLFVLTLSAFLIALIAVILWREFFTERRANPARAVGQANRAGARHWLRPSSGTGQQAGRGSALVRAGAISNSTISDNVTDADAVVDADQIDGSDVSRNRQSKEADEHESVDIIVQFHIARSAWARWQRALGALVGDDYMDIRHCAGALLRAAERGDLVITARPSAQIEREQLSRDFWRVACLGVRPDNNRIWKVFIRPRDGVSSDIEAQIAAKDYVDLTARMSDVKRLWPEKDERMDAETQRLLAEKEL